jgi:cellulose synthase/poly-beta-1,6-N-acetylglucosamine synthase-like glycosyltransferase
LTSESAALLPPSMLSFVVPAHNEQACLGRTVQAIHAAARATGRPYEVIVVDDASTDATAEVARKHDATVVSVNRRQIAATRNAGGRTARGERLFFVDADTVVSPRVVAAALRQLDRGAAGGGAPARFEGPVPLYAHLLMWWLGWLMRIAGMTGGAFMFMTREAFRATGGFNEKLFGAEDAAMCWALKREGRFAVLWPTVLTSGRRVRGTKGLRMLASLFRMAAFPRMLTRRASVEKVWYESNRDADDGVVDSLAVQAANAVILLLTVAIITGPLWGLIPWSWTPRASPLGQVRLGIAIFTCHVALVLWPCAYFLLRNLFRQRRWAERVKIVALSGVCVWLAWGGSVVVVWFWAGIWG